MDPSAEVFHDTASLKTIIDIDCLTPWLGWKEGMKAAQHVYAVLTATFQEVWSF